MAAEPSDTVSALEDQIQCNKVETILSCPNCALMKEQLLSTLQEFKSAETIICQLHEDMKYINQVTSTDTATLVSSEPTKEHNLTGEKWSAVNYSNKKISQTNASNAVNVEYTCVSTNRFAPLALLNESFHDEEQYEHKCKQLKPSQLSTKTSLHRRQGLKIHSFVNGVVSGTTNKK
jgi:hypothetical protein